MSVASIRHTTITTTTNNNLVLICIISVLNRLFSAFLEMKQL